MNSRTAQEITKMLNCFPQTNQNYELFLATLGQLCDGLTDQAVIEAAERFSAGLVADQSTRFAPSGPEFVVEARRRQEIINMHARPRLKAPEPRRSVGDAPFQLRTEALRKKHAHRPVIAENVTHEQFVEMSRRLPPGSSYVNSLSTVYGPDPSPRRQSQVQ